MLRAEDDDTSATCGAAGLDESRGATDVDSVCEGGIEAPRRGYRAEMYERIGAFHCRPEARRRGEVTPHDLDWRDGRLRGQATHE